MVISRKTLFKTVKQTTDMVNTSQYQNQQSLCETKLYLNAEVASAISAT